MFQCPTHPAYSYQSMICHDVHLMKSLITPLKWVLPINAGGCGFIHWLYLSSFEVAGRVRGRGRRGGVMNVLFKKLGIHYAMRGRMCASRNKAVDLETQPGAHESLLPAQNAHGEAYLCIHWISKCSSTTRRRAEFDLQKAEEWTSSFFLFLHVPSFHFMSHLSKQISPEQEQMLQIAD